MELGLRGIPSGDNLYCRCPLHDDRSASFSLNVFNGLWFCHAEQRGGSFGMLAAEILGVSLFAAERWISEQSYVVRPFPIERAEAPPDDTAQKRYEAARTDVLPDYWFNRGFTWETADAWGIRYDSAAERIVIPVRFPRDGELVGVITRAVRPGDEPKYRNSPDFPKRTTLFGYSAQVESSRILLVEGPLDAIRASQYGITAFATYGAYVTREQVRLLANCRNDVVVIVAMDNDGAGKESADQITKTVLGDVLSLRFRYPPDRKDVGELTQQEMYDGIANATGLY